MVITHSLILFAVMIPPTLRRPITDPPDFGPLGLAYWRRQGKDPRGKPMTASYQWTGGARSRGTMTKAQKP